jgi:RecJ-like exonuclease
MKKLVKKWYFWVIVVIVIIAVACTSNSEETTQDDSTQSETTAAATLEYDVVDLQQMLDDLSSNALKAEKTYQGKYIEVVGKIKNFDSDGNYISIEPVNADEWNFETVMCYIKNEAQLNFLLEKAVGDTITIKGKITSIGEVLGYSLNIDEIN